MNASLPPIPRVFEGKPLLIFDKGGFTYINLFHDFFVEDVDQAQAKVLDIVQKPANMSGLVNEQNIIYYLTAAHNADVDLAYCEAVISSHGHIDHAGGLFNIRRKMNTNQNTPLILHERAFRKRLVKFQDGRMISLPPPTRHILIQTGYNIVEQDASSLWIKDSILVTGEVPRTTNFEKGFPNHYSEIDGKMENDPLIKDDQALILP